MLFCRIALTLLAAEAAASETSTQEEMLKEMPQSPLKEIIEKSAAANAATWAAKGATDAVSDVATEMKTGRFRNDDTSLSKEEAQVAGEAAIGTLKAAEPKLSRSTESKALKNAIQASELVTEESSTPSNPATVKAAAYEAAQAAVDAVQDDLHTKIGDVEEGAVIAAAEASAQTLVKDSSKTVRQEVALAGEEAAADAAVSTFEDYGRIPNTNEKDTDLQALAGAEAAVDSIPADDVSLADEIKAAVEGATNAVAESADDIGEEMPTMADSVNNSGPRNLLFLLGVMAVAGFGVLHYRKRQDVVPPPMLGELGGSGPVKYEKDGVMDNTFAELGQGYQNLDA